MENIDLSLSSSWTAKSRGTEQYAGVPFGPDSLLAGKILTVMVVCDCQPFTQKDRDHARLRFEGLERDLQPALNRIIRHLSLKDVSEFLSCYGAPTLMLTAGDYGNWSLSFEHNNQPVSSIFCDWRNDEIDEVWVAD